MLAETESKKVFAVQVFHVLGGMGAPRHKQESWGWVCKETPKERRALRTSEEDLCDLAEPNALQHDQLCAQHAE